jgi:hypothetical protein
VPAPKRRKKQAGTGLRPCLHRVYAPVAQDEAWLEVQQRRPGFLCADVSGGVEKFRVPVFNEVDEEPAPTGFNYVRCEFARTEPSKGAGLFLAYPIMEHRLLEGSYHAPWLGLDTVQ